VSIATIPHPNKAHAGYGLLIGHKWEAYRQGWRAGVEMELTKHSALITTEQYDQAQALIQR
jgi:hypothetical protein